MNQNGTIGPIPIHYQNANPLLYTLAQDHTNIQPYWIMILQIAGLHLFSRLRHLFKYGVFSTTLEIGLLRWAVLYQLKTVNNVLQRVDDFVGNFVHNSESARERFIKEMERIKSHTHETNEKFYKKIDFDLIDYIIHGLPTLGHAIWYCYIQSSCMSAEQATPWNCYNAFGYRLFNYVFVSYWNFSFVFYVQLIAFIFKDAHNLNLPKKKQPKSIIKYVSFVITVGLYFITWAFAGALLLPYMFTHVIPMAFAYGFMVVIYFCLWGAVLFSTQILAELPKFTRIVFYIFLPRSLTGAFYSISAALYSTALFINTFPILLTVFYNYSQYLYYGENFIYTMSNEFNSRDTEIYFAIFRNSVNEKLHSLLDFV
ncbi:unnamed protein product [Adineta ricciae]|uniref:Uncharacterized protein n=1 Tax=Adineta ricciae TaxID=249248 RepID=A0A815S6G5_ADIRI|nr:unnamed protein product [Adineta ricciae]CAF1654764.1 unnamed protein product [Adineta ricciae]